MSDSIAYLPPRQINFTDDHASHLAGFASGGDLFTVRTALDPHMLVVENATAAGRGERERIAIDNRDLPALIDALQRVRNYMRECDAEWAATHWGDGA